MYRARGNSWHTPALLFFVLFLSLALFVLTAQAAPAGTIASWNFNEGSGSTIASDVGSILGTLSDTSWTTNGHGGNAVLFNGSKGSATAQSSSLDNLSSMTVTAWIKPISLGENNHGWIMAKAGGGTNLPSKGWALLLTNSDGNTVTFVVEYSGSHLEVVAKPNTLTLNAWNHVAVTWDGTQNASGVKIYINGTLVPPAYAANGNGSRSSDAGQPLIIGNNPNGSRTFNGTLDDATIAGRVFSASEIQSAMDSGTATPTPTQTPTPTAPTVNNGAGSASTADKKAPSKPRNLSGSAISTTQINLSWAPSTDNIGITGYDIYRNNSSLGTSLTASYADTAAAPGTSYTYKVRAKDAAGNTSTFSSTITVTTQVPPTTGGTGVTPPPPVSTKFALNARAYVPSGPLNTRTTANITGALLGTQATGAVGTIIGGPIAQGGYTWWNINYDTGTDGWSVENYLDKYMVPPSQPGTGAMPTGKILWDWQIGAGGDSGIKPGTGLQLIDVDLFTTSAAKVAELKSKGIYTVCYIDVGSWEAGRPDSDLYPESLKIHYDNDWDEWFLDVRDVFKPNSVLAKLLRDRFQLCKDKGFDAIEPDNLQNDENAGGKITRQQQIDFNGWVADEAHKVGLQIFQKNGPDKIDLKTTYDGMSMLQKFDGILNEECQQYNECNLLAKYVEVGKLALNTEYTKVPDCTLSDKLNINTIQKNLSLTTAKWVTCVGKGTPLTQQAAVAGASTVRRGMIGGTVVVIDTLRVRSNASVGQNSLGSAPAGITGVILDGPLEASGYTWLKVRYTNGLEGWSAVDWLSVQ